MKTNNVSMTQTQLQKKIVKILVENGKRTNVNVTTKPKNLSMANAPNKPIPATQQIVIKTI